MPRLVSQLCPFLAVQPQTSGLTSLCLMFFFDKSGLNNSTYFMEL